jgi:hypothetical protein
MANGFTVGEVQIVRTSSTATWRMHIRSVKNKMSRRAAPRFSNDKSVVFVGHRAKVRSLTFTTR